LPLHTPVMVERADLGDELPQPGRPKVLATVRGCAAEDAGSSHTRTVAEGAVRRARDVDTRRGARSAIPASSSAESHGTGRATSAPDRRDRRRPCAGARGRRRGCRSGRPLPVPESHVPGESGAGPLVGVPRH
jgi:hypothetical protein